jgi:hypothetical protein
LSAIQKFPHPTPHSPSHFFFHSISQLHFQSLKDSIFWTTSIVFVVLKKSFANLAFFLSCLPYLSSFHLRYRQNEAASTLSIDEVIVFVVVEVFAVAFIFVLSSVFVFVFFAFMIAFLPFCLCLSVFVILSLSLPLPVLNP